MSAGGAGGAECKGEIKTLWRGVGEMLGAEKAAKERRPGKAGRGLVTGSRWRWQGHDTRPVGRWGGGVWFSEAGEG